MTGTPGERFRLQSSQALLLRQILPDMFSTERLKAGHHQKLPFLPSFLAILLVKSSVIVKVCSDDDDFHCTHTRSAHQ